MEFHAWLITDIRAQQRKHVSNKILKQTICHLTNDTSPKSCKFLQGMNKKSCNIGQGKWERRKEPTFKENFRSLCIVK